MSDCCDIIIEPCHVGDCAGLDEVTRLLPDGKIWDLSNDSNISKIFRALAEIKRQVNTRMCGNYSEYDPCKSNHLLDFWGDVYSFPNCVPLTGENLCDWIKLVKGDDCELNSLGFINRAIEFVNPSLIYTLDLYVPDLGGTTMLERDCDDTHSLTMTVNPNELFYDPDDGLTVTDCKRYFIPEIECLRKCIIPFGLTFKYESDTSDYNDVPVTNQAVNEYKIYRCG